MATREDRLAAIRRAFPAGSGVDELDGGDMQTLRVDRRVLPDLARHLKGDRELDFKLLLDVCGVDYPGREERFEAVYHLYSLEHGHRLRLKVPVRAEDPVIPSVYGVWKAADWFEREAFDLMGIRFDGHPNLKRILCHPAFQGHALRKDYDPSQRWLLREGEQDEPTWARERVEDEGHLETQVLNFGPSHPATHGTLRTTLRLDGETIIQAETEIGFLHRCFEKMSETHTWNQVIPFTDRLNYCSAMMNGVGYALAVEKMLGIEAPPRAQLIRLILSELSRVMDHIVDIGANLNDLGAMTPFLYMYEAREEIYSVLEACCGARLTMSYVRIGGLSVDTPADFEEAVRYLLKRIPPLIDDMEKLITQNRIFRQRTEGVGKLTADEAVDWGWTGPCLRACGVGYDIRKAHPYLGYEQFDFKVPIAHTGDTYARYLVRVEEMRQSLRIVEQALAFLRPGPVIVDDHNVALPPKEEVYTEMESLIWHFKLIMEGMKVPAGETYGYTEGANGELGFYLISDGGGKPYRVKVRPPCFAIFQAYPHMLEGHMVSDAVAILGSLNVIAGELDR
ncbi:MAG: NADH dehydrogenase (quinone) subunit D [Acidobacteriota bacterium]